VKWPAGFRSAGVHAGIKGNDEPDLGLIVADTPGVWAGTFTRNAAAAAPVHRSRARLGSPLRAVVVNSGNANACTGSAGFDAVDATAAAAAAALGCTADQIGVASTGPIGRPLPVALVVDGIPSALDRLDSDVESFARAIMTTDTRLKVEEERAGAARVVGVAKGAAMLAPNMATMLAFLATDARASVGELQVALDAAVSRSFDRISIDACESTNDSVFCLASGIVDAERDELGRALAKVCARLARAMVEDAEGASKVVVVRVEGAASEEAAALLGRAVAASNLWSAAAYGADPNWGRVLAAMGAVDRSLDPSAVQLGIGGIPLFDRGEPVPAGLEDAARAMRGPEFEVVCRVGSGSGAATILTCDLTPDYVKLNAEGTT